MNNLYLVPEGAAVLPEEITNVFLRGKGALRAERIISHGQTTPKNMWYDQEEDEWVSVIVGDARILFEEGQEISLQAGDTLLIPKHIRHRVTYTSSPCIWLAIFGTDLQETGL